VSVACQEEFTDIEVEYCCLPGWLCSTVGCRQFADLPVNAQAYVNKIQELTGVHGLSLCVSAALFAFTQHFIDMPSVIREYVIDEYFACCRIFHIFQQSAHSAYFFPHKLAFLAAFLIILILLVFLFKSIFNL